MRRRTADAQNLHRLRIIAINFPDLSFCACRATHVFRAPPVDFRRVGFIPTIAGKEGGDEHHPYDSASSAT